MYQLEVIRSYIHDEVEYRDDTLWLNFITRVGDECNTGRTSNTDDIFDAMDVILKEYNGINPRNTSYLIFATPEDALAFKIVWLT